MLTTLTKAYQTLIFLGGLLKSPILLLCRLYWGWLFMVAGWEKLHNISHFVSILDRYDLPFSPVLAYLAAGTECIGGLCLLLGFASRLVAIPLIITLITAYLTVHAEAVHTIFQKPSAFVAEAPFNFLLTALIVLAFGPGRFSIDYMIEKWLFSKAEDIPKHQHLPK